jgi:hypothetical protein
MIISPEYNDIFNAGKQFAKTFPQSLDNLDMDPLLIKSNGANNGGNNGSKNRKSKADAINFMQGVMDECTHLGNFSAPVDPTLSIIVSALRDGYVPQEGLIPLTKLWTGSDHRTLDCGHVAAILFNSETFRKAIIDSLQLNAQKYYSTSLVTEDRAKA